MQLTLAKPTVVASGGLTAAHQYGMNIARIQSYLRQDIYADPMRAAVQEYLSNGRDAQRENHCELPLEVSFTTPYDDETSVSFTDHGPGIDPGRHLHFFAAYGWSTKHDDPTQIGKFGLGCKTGFADRNRDSFTVVTTWRDGHDDDGTGETAMERWLSGTPMHGTFRRTYRHFIDEQSMNSFELVSHERVDDSEPTGTTVTLPCDSSELAEFYRTVQDVTLFWNPKPRLLGVDGSWAITHGLPYGIYKDFGNWGYLRGTTSDVILVVDDIPYRVLPSDFGKLPVCKVWARVTNEDVEVTATREKLDLNEKTKVAVLGLLTELSSTITESMDDKEMDDPYFSWYEETAQYVSDLSESNRSVRAFKVTPKWDGKEGWDFTEDKDGEVRLRRIAVTVEPSEWHYRSSCLGHDFGFVKARNFYRKPARLPHKKLAAIFAANPSLEFLLVGENCPPQLGVLEDMPPAKFVKPPKKRQSGTLTVWRSAKRSPSAKLTLRKGMRHPYFLLTPDQMEEVGDLLNTAWVGRVVCSFAAKAPEGFMDPLPAVMKRLQRAMERLEPLPSVVAVGPVWKRARRFAAFRHVGDPAVTLQYRKVQRLTNVARVLGAPVPAFTWKEPDRIHETCPREWELRKLRRSKGWRDYNLRLTLKTRSKKRP